MSHLRIYGDPFAGDALAVRVRALLRLAADAGATCSLALDAVAEHPVRPGGRAIALADGARQWQVGTDLEPAEIGRCLAAAREVVPATAPLVVFAAAGRLEDEVRRAGLCWPAACAVLAAEEGIGEPELLGRALAAAAAAGVAPDEAIGVAGVSAAELRRWLALPPIPSTGALVHVGAADWLAGIDLVLALWHASLARTGRRLRLVLPGADDRAVLRVAEELEATGGCWEIVRGPLRPRHLADAAAVLLPWRALRSPAVLAQALASARPVCLSNWAETAALVDGAGATLPVGGRRAPLADGSRCFEPDIDSFAAAVDRALEPGGAAVGERGRRHALTALVGGPAEATAAAATAAAATAAAAAAATVPAVPARPRARPSVVLEAPLFETSSSAELSIETALALVRRGHVDLRLVPRLPLVGTLAEFRRRAPALEPLLTRTPGHADLWLSSGWPVRAARPACRAFALRVDWEYGALPTELAPHVTEEADLVVVHSEHVAATVVAAGRSRAGVQVIPHGVGEAIDEAAIPDPEIARWKGGLPAVLFCGGLVWRKGFDVFLRTALAAHARGARFAVVVKSVGGASHYRGFDLRALLDRFAATPGTPPVLLLERDLSRSQLASLYTACDLLLHPYRGEGFCLPVLEARAAGLPVLATAGGATEAFLAGPGARRLPANRREIELPGAHLGRPWVLEPDAEAAADALVEALAELPSLRPAARRFAPAVRTAFSWSAAASAIERLAGAAVGAAPEPAVQLVPAARPAARAAVPRRLQGHPSAAPGCRLPRR